MKSIILVPMMAALLPWQGVTSQTQATTSATNDQGKAIFSERCGKCHDADASKKLPDGTTLLARLAKNKDPETRLATRLKDEQERHQVFLYLQPMIERERSSETQKLERQSDPHAKLQIFCRWNVRHRTCRQFRQQRLEVQMPRVHSQSSI